MIAAQLADLRGRVIIVSWSGHDFYNSLVNMPWSHSIQIVRSFGYCVAMEFLQQLVDFLTFPIVELEVIAEVD